MATPKPLTGKGNEITRETGLESEDCTSLTHGEEVWNPKYNQGSVCKEKGEGGLGELTLSDPGRCCFLKLGGENHQDGELHDLTSYLLDFAPPLMHCYNPKRARNHALHVGGAQLTSSV